MHNVCCCSFVSRAGTSKTSQAADLPSQHDTKAAPEKELEKTEKATNFKASFSGKQQTKRTKNIGRAHYLFVLNTDR